MPSNAVVYLQQTTPTAHTNITPTHPCLPLATTVPTPFHPHIPQPYPTHHPQQLLTTQPHHPLTPTIYTYHTLSVSRPLTWTHATPPFPRPPYPSNTPLICHQPPFPHPTPPYTHSIPPFPHATPYSIFCAALCLFQYISFQQIKWSSEKKIKRIMNRKFHWCF